MSNVDTKQTVKTTVHEAVNTDSELYKVGTVVTAAFAGGIGLWAVICLSSAFMSEGPVALLKSLFGAVSGTM
ncbi:hypothetical protein UWK_03026 [Desulfocapsa sulfexigens DSM 10523]|uniref:Uncharacterized protein n=1 Tax=Desulfocapsa sulfexigens (strain DSM 10523 / SB164P1) TaxID=1167006 RepID=M1PJ09_DESSD|nr:hypothetical protein [Desulfocapsa sulfexigens]AGF79555.1 hypothetical protein UWK_03026 [Desulfocapsa sulfexigens DSM 10523]